MARSFFTHQSRLSRGERHKNSTTNTFRFLLCVLATLQTKQLSTMKKKHSLSHSSLPLWQQHPHSLLYSHDGLFLPRHPVAVAVGIHDSVRSLSSEGSTIPTTYTNDDENFKNKQPPRTCQCPSQSQQQHQRQLRVVRFSETTNVIPRRQYVHFAPFVQEYDAPQAHAHVSPQTLWYSTRDYARFRHSTEEMCHLLAEKPWFTMLSDLHEQLQLVNNETSTTTTATTTATTHTILPDAWVLGLEHWIVTAPGRLQRRTRLLTQIQHHQRQQQSVPSHVVRRRVHCVSVQHSRPDCAWARLVAQQVARSVSL